MLVTAFEANEDVPNMKNVTNCLLHEERKLTERMVSDARREGIFMKESKRNEGHIATT